MKGDEGCIWSNKTRGNSSDEGQLHGQVDAFVFSTCDASRQRHGTAHGDGDASVMEPEATGKSNEDCLVLEQR